MANKSLWKDEYLFDAYELTRHGAKEKQLSGIFGISLATFLQWERKRPLLRMALAMGRGMYRKRAKVHKHGSELAEYVFNSLSPEMKSVWKKLSAASRAKSPKAVMDSILAGKGKTFRQYLFMYAFVTGNFRITEAMKRIGLSVREFDRWKLDPDFKKLFQEVIEAKKDLCESHLLNLVKKGSEAATIYSVKALCKDRGYNEKMDVNVNVKGEINHNVLTFDRIRPFLSSQAQMEILEALKKAKELESGGSQNTPLNVPRLTGNIVEAEFLPNV